MVGRKLACGEQTHFSAFVSPAEKIASAISSCKTISVTPFLFIFTQPMKDGIDNTRGPTAALKAAQMATPKKVTLAEGDCFVCKDKIPSLKEKVKIFGKSELEIGTLIHRSLGVDLSV